MTRSRLSAEEKAENKKSSQLHWYQRNMERERQLARARSAERRASNRIQSTRRSCKKGQGVQPRFIATPAQRRKDFHCSAKAQGCSAAVATVDDSEEDLPIASYDSDDNLPPSSEPRYSSPLPSPDHTPRQSPDRTPRQSPEPTPGPFNAVNCLVTVAEFATQWNSEWGTIPQWSHQFTTRYLTAVEEMRSVEFIEGVARKARIGRALIDDIAHLISNSTLPTTVSLLRVFIELTVKITIKLIKGVTILEEKLKSVTPFTGNGLRNFLASVEPGQSP